MPVLPSSHRPSPHPVSYKLHVPKDPNELLQYHKDKKLIQDAEEGVLADGVGDDGHGGGDFGPHLMGEGKDTTTNTTTATSASPQSMSPVAARKSRDARLAAVEAARRRVGVYEAQYRREPPTTNTNNATSSSSYSKSIRPPLDQSYESLINAEMTNMVFKFGATTTSNSGGATPSPLPRDFSASALSSYTAAASVAQDPDLERQHPTPPRHWAGTPSSATFGTSAAGEKDYYSSTKNNSNGAPPQQQPPAPSPRYPLEPPFETLLKATVASHNESQITTSINSLVAMDNLCCKWAPFFVAACEGALLNPNTKVKEEYSSTLWEPSVPVERGIRAWDRDGAIEYARDVITAGINIKQQQQQEHHHHHNDSGGGGGPLGPTSGPNSPFSQSNSTCRFAGSNNNNNNRGCSHHHHTNNNTMMGASSSTQQAKWLGVGDYTNGGGAASMYGAASILGGNAYSSASYRPGGGGVSGGAKHLSSSSTVEDPLVVEGKNVVVGGSAFKSTFSYDWYKHVTARMFEAGLLNKDLPLAVKEPGVTTNSINGGGGEAAVLSHLPLDPFSSYFIAQEMAGSILSAPVRSSNPNTTANIPPPTTQPQNAPMGNAVVPMSNNDGGSTTASRPLSPTSTEHPHTITAAAPPTTNTITRNTNTTGGDKRINFMSKQSSSATTNNNNNSDEGGGSSLPDLYSQHCPKWSKRVDRNSLDVFKWITKGVDDRLDELAQSGLAGGDNEDDEDAAPRPPPPQPNTSRYHLFRTFELCCELCNFSLCKVVPQNVYSGDPLRYLHIANFVEQIIADWTLPTTNSNSVNNKTSSAASLMRFQSAGSIIPMPPRPTPPNGATATSNNMNDGIGSVSAASSNASTPRHNSASGAAGSVKTFFATLTVVDKFLSKTRQRVANELSLSEKKQELIETRQRSRLRLERALGALGRKRLQTLVRHFLIMPTVENALDAITDLPVKADSVGGSMLVHTRATRTVTSALGSPVKRHALLASSTYNQPHNSAAGHDTNPSYFNLDKYVFGNRFRVEEGSEGGLVAAVAEELAMSLYPSSSSPPTTATSSKPGTALTAAELHQNAFNRHEAVTQRAQRGKQPHLSSITQTLQAAADRHGAWLSLSTPRQRHPPLHACGHLLQQQCLSAQAITLREELSSRQSRTAATAATSTTTKASTRVATAIDAPLHDRQQMRQQLIAHTTTIHQPDASSDATNNKPTSSSANMAGSSVGGVFHLTSSSMKERGESRVASPTSGRGSRASTPRPPTPTSGGDDGSATHNNSEGQGGGGGAKVDATDVFDTEDFHRPRDTILPILALLEVMMTSASSTTTSSSNTNNKGGDGLAGANNDFVKSLNPLQRKLYERVGVAEAVLLQEIAHHYSCFVRALMDPAGVRTAANTDNNEGGGRKGPPRPPASLFHQRRLVLAAAPRIIVDSVVGFLCSVAIPEGGSQEASVETDERRTRRIKRVLTELIFAERDNARRKDLHMAARDSVVTVVRDGTHHQQQHPTPTTTFLQTGDSTPAAMSAFTTLPPDVVSSARPSISSSSPQHPFKNNGQSISGMFPTLGGNASSAPQYGSNSAPTQLLSTITKQVKFSETNKGGGEAFGDDTVDATAPNTNDVSPLFTLDKAMSNNGGGAGNPLIQSAYSLASRSNHSSSRRTGGGGGRGVAGGMNNRVFHASQQLLLKDEGLRKILLEEEHKEETRLNGGVAVVVDHHHQSMGGMAHRRGTLSPLEDDSCPQSSSPRVTNLQQLSAEALLTATRTQDQQERKEKQARRETLALYYEVVGRIRGELLYLFTGMDNRQEVLTGTLRTLKEQYMKREQEARQGTTLSAMLATQQNYKAIGVSGTSTVGGTDMSGVPRSSIVSSISHNSNNNNNNNASRTISRGGGGGEKDSTRTTPNMSTPIIGRHQSNTRKVPTAPIAMMGKLQSPSTTTTTSVKRTPTVTTLTPPTPRKQGGVEGMGTTTTPRQPQLSPAPSTPKNSGRDVGLFTPKHRGTVNITTPTTGGSSDQPTSSTTTRAASTSQRRPTKVFVWAPSAEKVSSRRRTVAMGTIIENEATGLRMLPTSTAQGPTATMARSSSSSPSSTPSSLSRSASPIYPHPQRNSSGLFPSAQRRQSSFNNGAPPGGMRRSRASSLVRSAGGGPSGASAQKRRDTLQTTTINDSRGSVSLFPSDAATPTTHAFGDMRELMGDGVDTLTPAMQHRQEKARRQSSVTSQPRPSRTQSITGDISGGSFGASPSQPFASSFHDNLNKRQVHQRRQSRWEAKKRRDREESEAHVRNKILVPDVARIPTSVERFLSEERADSASPSARRRGGNGDHEGGTSPSHGGVRSPRAGDMAKIGSPYRSTADLRNNKPALVTFEESTPHPTLNNNNGGGGEGQPSTTSTNNAVNKLDNDDDNSGETVFQQVPRSLTVTAAVLRREMREIDAIAANMDRTLRVGTATGKKKSKKLRRRRAEAQLYEGTRAASSSSSASEEDVLGQFAGDGGLRYVMNVHSKEEAKWDKLLGLNDVDRMTKRNKCTFGEGGSGQHPVDPTSSTATSSSALVHHHHNHLPGVTTKEDKVALNISRSAMERERLFTANEVAEARAVTRSGMIQTNSDDGNSAVAVAHTGGTNPSSTTIGGGQSKPNTAPSGGKRCGVATSVPSSSHINTHNTFALKSYSQYNDLGRIGGIGVASSSSSTSLVTTTATQAGKTSNLWSPTTPFTALHPPAPQAVLLGLATTITSSSASKSSLPGGRPSALNEDEVSIQINDRGVGGTTTTPPTTPSSSPPMTEQSRQAIVERRAAQRAQDLQEERIKDAALSKWSDYDKDPARYFRQQHKHHKQLKSSQGSGEYEATVKAEIRSVRKVNKQQMPKPSSYSRANSHDNNNTTTTTAYGEEAFGEGTTRSESPSSSINNKGGGGGLRVGELRVTTIAEQRTKLSGMSSSSSSSDSSTSTSSDEEQEIHDDGGQSTTPKTRKQKRDHKNLADLNVTAGHHQHDMDGEPVNQVRGGYMFDSGRQRYVYPVPHAPTTPATSGAALPKRGKTTTKPRMHAHFDLDPVASSVLPNTSSTNSMMGSIPPTKYASVTESVVGVDAAQTVERYKRKLEMTLPSGLLGGAGASVGRRVNSNNNNAPPHGSNEPHNPHRPPPSDPISGAKWFERHPPSKTLTQRHQEAFGDEYVVKGYMTPNMGNTGKMALSDAYPGGVTPSSYLGGDSGGHTGVASNLLQRGTFDVNQSTPLTSVWLSGAGPPPSVTANLAHRAPLSSSGHSTPRPQPSATPRRPNTSASTATSRSSTSNQPPASVSNSRLIQWTF